MPPAKYAKSRKFADLSANERARRIGKIRDPKKQQAAARYWGVSPSDRSLMSPQAQRLRAGTKKIERALSPPSAGGFVKNVLLDPVELAKEIGKSAVEIGGAASRDIRAGRGLWKPGGLAFGESEGRDIALETIRGIPAQAKLLADPMAWYRDPLIQVFNLATFALPAARVGSVGRIATQVRKANPGMSRLQANKAALVESFNPGFLAAQEIPIKGGIKPRVQRSAYGTTPGKMPSRTPVGRAGQRAWDASKRFRDVQRSLDLPDLPGLRDKTLRVGGPAAIGSASRQVQAQQRKAAQREVSRSRATRQQNEEIVAAAIAPSRRERFKRAAGQAGRTDPAMGAALVAALEGPATASVRTAIQHRIDALTKVLKDNEDLAPLDEALRDLRDQREEMLAADPKAKTADIDKQIQEGQEQLDFLLGRDVPEVTGSPLRDAVFKHMRGTIGDTKAEQTIKIWDARARAMDEKDPAAAYAQMISGVRRMPAGEFAPEGQTLFQRMAADQGGWYFPLMRSLAEMPEQQTMQVGQLVKALQKRGVSTEEMRNSGLAEVLERNRDLVVTPGQLLDELQVGGYLRRFDPDVQVTRTRDIPDRSDPRAPYGTLYDPADAPQLNSRVAESGEYHEMVVRYPEESGSPSGEQHWHKPGVAYHVRFQRFVDEDGQVAMLVDEIQSDWASDYRKAAKAGEAATGPRDYTGTQPSPMGPKRYLNNAVRQIVRWADDNDVDYIVLTDGRTQALRNRATDLGVDDGVSVRAIPDSPENLGEYIDIETGEPLSNGGVAAKLAAQEEAGSFTRLYNQEIPDVFRKLFDAEPQHFDDAYTGYHGAQSARGEGLDGYMQLPEGGMPGTVIPITTEMVRKARQEQPLYRRDLDGVPQGATEFLADGRARVTMFETADVSTWVHELAHVAVKDLDPEDRAILEREIAEGRSYDEWGEADHERYARQFEEYIREGHAAPALREVFAKITEWMRNLWHQVAGEAESISPATADVFDRMLGRRYQNTVVLDQNEVAQVMDDIKNLKEALDSGDTGALTRAADALQALSRQAEEAGIAILTRGKTEAQKEAILEGLAERKNLVVEDYRRRGVMSASEEARGYFPQFSQWEALGQPQIGPSRMAAVGGNIGTPRVTAKTLNKNRNKLVRFQTGEVLNDPAAVLYVLRARLRLQETIRARDELWAVARPIREFEDLPEEGTLALIRNPDVAPERIRTATEAAVTLSRKDYARLQKRRAIEDSDQIDTQGAAEEMIYIPERGKTRPEWTKDEENVRAIPAQVARKRLGDVFTSAPKGWTSIPGLFNAAARIALIYAPLGGARYVFRNWVQNAVMLALTQPSAFGKLMSNRGLRERYPVLWDRINEEFGTIQAAALPEFNIRAQGKLQRGERSLTRASGQYGEFLGKGADVPLRAASWRRHAERYGFTTPEDYRRLLDEPELAEIRNTVAQRTREDLIDFDALSPWEKETLSRFLFIWPFIRGATKWPFMFAREYPGRVGALSLATGATTNVDDEAPLGEQLMVGDYDLAWLNPTGPALENAERIQAVASRVSRGNWNLSPAAGLLSPQYQTVLEAFSGNLGKDVPHTLLNEFLPLFSTFEAAVGGKKKFVDFGLRTFGKQTRPRSVEKKAKEWMSDVDKALEWADERGYTLPPAAKAEVERMRVAYADWAEESSRAKWAHQDAGEDSVADIDRTLLLLGVMQEHYPEEYEQAQQEAQQATGDSAEAAVASDQYDNARLYRRLYDMMFGLKEEIVSEAKESGFKP